jgi:hypothetical protein
MASVVPAAAQGLSAALGALGGVLGAASLAMSWLQFADKPGNLLAGHVSLDHACLAARPALAIGGQLVCSSLRRETARALFESLGGKGSPENSTALLATVRTLALIGVLIRVALAVMSALFSFGRGGVSRFRALLPLFLAAVSIPLGVVALALFSSLARTGFTAGMRGVEASVGAGWVLQLLSTIFGGVPILPAALDLFWPRGAAVVSSRIPPVLRETTERAAKKISEALPKIAEALPIGGGKEQAVGEGKSPVPLAAVSTTGAEQRRAAAARSRSPGGTRRTAAGPVAPGKVPPRAVSPVRGGGVAAMATGAPTGEAAGVRIE